MASSTDPVKQVAGSIDTSIRLAARLEQLLLDESLAIQSRDPERLLAIVADKKTLIVTLEEETGRQRDWIQGEGFSFDPPGVAACFARLDPSERLIRRWIALRDAIARCNLLNQTNASLIDRDRKRIAMSLQILRGEDESPATYSPRGQAESSEPRSRILSRA